ncbi:hypothetical protein DCE79_08895 [Lysinibacillus sp. 2017]|uniref:hypothetical protein n=1 Tax=unclassified Lysinibacillus TaxID=2636778 RepID=UPI000D5280F8|nr:MULTISPECIES: hypothetical protein [unclassified Lysinibacillus]AWE07484.1 hypothetical protein DCE79_08895 [Lysinibacillus sp. 2017]TGN36647.1 hypothetical protein E4L99_03600 [Lysinibacillus sp. S2017]
MKKIVSSILALIVLLIVVFLLLFNKETTLKEEGFGGGIEKVSEIEISRVSGSDEKKINLYDGQAKELFNQFLNTKLSKVENVDGEFTESFYIIIRDNEKRALGIRIDNTLAFSPYDYNGNSKNNKDYLLEDDSILKSIEQFFE